MMHRTCGLTAILLLLPMCASAARQSFTASDLWLWRTAEDARISPDGHWIVYVERSNDRATNTANSNLWLASSDGKQKRPLTEGARADTSPRWAPDNERVAYLSGGQIHVRGLNADSKDAQLTNFPLPGIDDCVVAGW